MRNLYFKEYYIFKDLDEKHDLALFMTMCSTKFAAAK